ncbi:ABC transporter substrate-binding protein [Oscillatoriales cyanobacterium LEGE 11467]|uniref:ABC transporter substrate-binding protein n=1 Tax=Zarconia navalis LEGE 11467 TaxID=1828826 RepID=A0A928Z8A8_9CYAN|nr:CHAT domain-containing protein [Zarconia navalis]MBE9040478.1 ABC transporter substrate-binding protein [Zarconia navalis LEGE 11467]
MNENYAILLTFGTGKDNGLSVVAKLLRDGQQIETRKRRSIAALPDLQDKYARWKEHYIQQTTRITIPPAISNHSSLDDCQNAARELKAYLEQWFDSPKFETLKEWIIGRVLGLPDPSVPIFFEFDTCSHEQNTFLRRLPWSCWDLFDELPNADAALSIAYGKPMESRLRNLKILAVFGSDEGGIDLEADRRFVSQLEQWGAQVRNLSCPEPEKLYSRLKHRAYDVLFFAGHSLSTDEQRNGEILLQPQRPVSMKQLLPCLHTAARRGLKLAIFNSCDGLGLADLLIAKAKIPSVVVFREPVPDEVARRFLEYFLQEFSNGTPLFRAVREARNQLQFLEDRPENPLPCASWLPVVCQNPSQSELVWDKTTRKRWWKIGAALLAFVALSGAAIEFWTRMRSPDVVLSRGETLVMASQTNNAKERGLAAMGDRNWEDAIAAFRQSLNQELQENETLQIKDSLDPETWIYLNNAIAEQKAENQIGQLAQLAISVPAKDKPGEQLISKEFLQGAALRQAEFNCGVEKLITAIKNLDISLDCVPEDNNNFIHITIANDLSNEDISKYVAAELSKTSILGTIGHFSSAACIKAGKVYDRNEVVMISPTCTSTSIQESLGFSDYFFRTVPNDAVAAKSLWSKVKTNNAEVAIAYSRNSEYSESFKTAFEKQIPSKKYTYICDELEDNFYAPGCAEAAKAEGANFLLLVPTTTQTLNATLSILTHLDWKLVPLGSDSVYNSAIIDPDGYGKQAAETGLQIYVSWHPSLNPNNRTDFEKNATRMFDFEDWNWHSQSSYDAMSALTQGIRELDGVLSGEKLMQKLRNPDFAADGVVGEGSVKFLQNGDRDLRDFEDKIGAIIGVEEYRDETGVTDYRFVRVDE